MSGISTHILDTATGRPAVGVGVSLARLRDGSDCDVLAQATTDADGRCRQLLPDAQQLAPGIYRIRFETGAYYDSRRTEGLYPFVEITFTVRTGDEHVHIPLLVSANGYTTYRGN